MEKKLLKTLMSESTVEKLDTALGKGNIDLLKKHMEKLFTFKNIFNMHDDHLVELAECIIDLSRAEDRVECARDFERYAQRMIARYSDRKARAERKCGWLKATKSKNELDILDAKYRQWVYESGFEYSHYHMYSMLCQITRDIQEGAVK